MRVIARLHSVHSTSTTLRTANPLLTIRKSRIFRNSSPDRAFSSRNFTTTATAKMSFSNADTGSKPEDPYKEKNKEEASLKEKVEDLVNFMDKCKFAMMTTRIESTGQLVSRCMALAAKVRHSLIPIHHTSPYPIHSILFKPSLSHALHSLYLSHANHRIGIRRHRPPLPHQHRIRQNRRPGL